MTLHVLVGTGDIEMVEILTACEFQGEKYNACFHWQITESVKVVRNTNHMLPSWSSRRA
jgi:hypothetical protein